MGLNALRLSVRPDSQRHGVHVTAPRAKAASDLSRRSVRAWWTTVAGSVAKVCCQCGSAVNGLLKGVFGTFRNPPAHTPRAAASWTITEPDALDLFSTLSLIHRRLDRAVVAST